MSAYEILSVLSIAIPLLREDEMHLGWRIYDARLESPRSPRVEWRVVLRIASTILMTVGAILLLYGVVLQIGKVTR